MLCILRILTYKAKYPHLIVIFSTFDVSLSNCLTKYVTICDILLYISVVGSQKYQVHSAKSIVPIRYLSNGWKLQIMTV